MKCLGRTDLRLWGSQTGHWICGHNTCLFLQSSGKLHWWRYITTPYAKSHVTYVWPKLRVYFAGSVPSFLYFRPIQFSPLRLIQIFPTFRYRSPRPNLTGTWMLHMLPISSRAVQLSASFSCSVAVLWHTNPKSCRRYRAAPPQRNSLPQSTPPKLPSTWGPSFSNLDTRSSDRQLCLRTSNAAPILMVNASRPTPRASHINIQHIPGVGNSTDFLTAKSLGSTLHHRHICRLMEPLVHLQFPKSFFLCWMHSCLIIATMLTMEECVCAYLYIFDTVLPINVHSQLLLLGAATVLSPTIVLVPSWRRYYLRYSDKSSLEMPMCFMSIHIDSHNFYLAQNLKCVPQLRV